MEMILSTGYELAEDFSSLQLYMEIDLLINDPFGLLANSNDPSYMSSEVFI